MSFRTVRQLVFLLSIGALPSPSTQIPRISFEELIHGSEFIVHGRVARSWSGWDARQQFIWTHHEIEITEAIRGRTRDRITVSEPGGEVDGVGQSFGGALPYGAGEEVVLFLERTPIGWLRATGGGQGKFTVGRDGRARANLSGMELVDPPGARRGVPIAAVDGLALRDLKQRVRGAAALYPYRTRAIR